MTAASTRARRLRLAAGAPRMLKMRVIPCLDVKDGRVVKGVNFVDLVDAGDPVAQARFYDREGADELCFLDITASPDGRDTLYDVVRRTAEECFMPLTVGGGVRTVEDIRRLLLAGADKVSINTAAVARPEFVREAAQKFGSQCIVAAIDAKAVAPGRWEVFTHGGRRPTGIDAVDWARRLTDYGAGEILLTSMDRDGTKSGFDIALDPRRRRRGSRAGHRLGRRRHARSSGRGHPRRPRDRGAGGLDLSFRDVADRRGQGAARRLRHPGAGLSDAEELGAALDRLWQVIKSRRGADPQTSYTARLFARGRTKIAQKLGEEAVEAVIEGVRGDRGKARRRKRRSALSPVCAVGRHRGLAVGCRRRADAPRRHLRARRKARPGEFVSGI